MEQIIFSKEENIALNKDATIKMFNKNYEKNREIRLKDVHREIIDNEYWIQQNTENNIGFWPCCGKDAGRRWE